MMRLEIHPLYKELLTGRIIDYCTRQAGSEKEEEPLRFLLDIDPELLNVDQRKELCDAMISRSYMKEAYGHAEAVLLQDRAGELPADLQPHDLRTDV